MHLLPGLVLYAQRHLSPGQPLTATDAARPLLASGMHTWDEAALWLLAVPTAVYLVWQLAYWIIVQVRLVWGVRQGTNIHTFQSSKGTSQALTTGVSLQPLICH